MELLKFLCQFSQLYRRIPAANGDSASVSVVDIFVEIP